MPQEAKQLTAPAAKSPEGGTCPVSMSDDKPCGRPIHLAPPGADPKPACLMHSHDPDKDTKQFLQEIEAILSGTSVHHRPKDRLDFTRFVFPEASFRGATFTQGADFREATFTQNADFYGATFTQNANFIMATFTQSADFIHTVFGPPREAVTAAAPVASNPSAAVADFRGARFQEPALARFYRVNQKSSQQLRIRFLNCQVEGVRFEDVNWHRQGGRMVLQDELDISDIKEPRPDHELVAIAYRQLVNNFEKARAYDLAEDCKIGAMEMKRLDPVNFLFAKRLEAYYRKWRWLRWVGEHLSAAGLYRWASNYGSSYRRAFGVLLFLLIVFAVGFTVVGIQPRHGVNLAPALNQRIKSPKAYVAGGLHSLEVATFQRDTFCTVTTRFGRVVAILETVLVPAQLALFLLALRRRFRH